MKAADLILERHKYWTLHQCALEQSSFSNTRLLQKICPGKSALCIFFSNDQCYKLTEKKYYFCSLLSIPWCNMKMVLECFYYSFIHLYFMILPLSQTLTFDLKMRKSFLRCIIFIYVYIWQTLSSKWTCTAFRVHVYVSSCIPWELNLTLLLLAFFFFSPSN